MELSFDPEDIAEFERVRDALADQFEATPEGAERGWVARQVMDLKVQYLDGDLARWSNAQSEGILLELYPAKVIVEPDDLSGVVPAFASFLRFLAAEGILQGGIGEGERLARFVERLSTQFMSAVTDEARWSMGKRLTMAALADGVDFTDRDATERWMAEFNERSFAERDSLLGPPSIPAAC